MAILGWGFVRFTVSSIATTPSYESIITRHGRINLALVPNTMYPFSKSMQDIRKLRLPPFIPPLFLTIALHFRRRASVLPCSPPWNEHRWYGFHYLTTFCIKHPIHKFRKLKKVWRRRSKCSFIRFGYHCDLCCYGFENWTFCFVLLMFWSVTAPNFFISSCQPCR